MTPKADRAGIDRAKEALKKIDPQLVAMAIRRADIDRGDVDKIKEFLSKHNPEAVHTAMAELDNEIVEKEVKKVSDDLRGFDKETLEVALGELGIRPLPCDIKIIAPCSIRIFDPCYIRIFDPCHGRIFPCDHQIGGCHTGLIFCGSCLQRMYREECEQRMGLIHVPLEEYMSQPELIEEISRKVIAELKQAKIRGEI